jgi:hypothetical protein
MLEGMSKKEEFEDAVEGEEGVWYKVGIGGGEREGGYAIMRGLFFLRVGEACSEASRDRLYDGLNYEPFNARLIMPKGGYSDEL